MRYLGVLETVCALETCSAEISCGRITTLKYDPKVHMRTKCKYSLRKRTKNSFLPEGMSTNRVQTEYRVQVTEYRVQVTEYKQRTDRVQSTDRVQTLQPFLLQRLFRHK
jgi:hypothetical protein